MSAAGVDKATVASLRRFDRLAGLVGRSLAAIQRLMRVRRRAVGQAIIAPAHANQDVVLLLDGEVRVTHLARADRRTAVRA